MKSEKSQNSFLNYSKRFTVDQAIKVIKKINKNEVCKKEGHQLVFRFGKGFYGEDHYVCKKCGKIERIEK